MSSRLGGSEPPTLNLLSRTPNSVGNVEFLELRENTRQQGERVVSAADSHTNAAQSTTRMRLWHRRQHTTTNRRSRHACPSTAENQLQTKCPKSPQLQPE